VLPKFTAPELCAKIYVPTAPAVVTSEIVPLVVMVPPVKPVPVATEVTVPEDVGAALVHAVPLLVNTLPLVPGAVSPVPPAAAGSVPAVIADDEVE
jgi:hypothetical protein